MTIALHRIGGSFARGWLALAAFVCLLAFSGQVKAAREILSANYEGASSVDVAPGADTKVTVSVKTTGSGNENNWGSIAWYIGDYAYYGAWYGSTASSGCQAISGANSTNTYNKTISVNAPSSTGTYDLLLVAYSDGNCSSGASNVFPLTNSFIVSSVPRVSSLSLVNANPVEPNTDVSWTVTFNRPVSNVDANDFQLVTTGTVTGSAIKSVTGPDTGIGSTWTVTANVGSGGNSGGTLGLNLVDDDSIVDANGRKLGGTGVGNGNHTGPTYIVAAACEQPSNTPAGLTLNCRCDSFTRSSLNPSTIFGANWVTSVSDSTGISPRIVNSGYLRLTENTKNNAKAITVPGVFPAAGNYISVEFRHYAYNSTTSSRAGDGVAVTLSDYLVSPVPGAYGGSLGYAQKTTAGGAPSNVSGFAGGWVGVGLDEFGNYQNPTEGRVGKVGGSEVQQSVAIRGSGSGTSGYPWLAGTGSLTTKIDSASSSSPAPGYSYQVIVDARNYKSTSKTAAVRVNRDTGSGTYASLLSLDDIYVAARNVSHTQADVPSFWQISFTGSTGDATNIHELGRVRICAQAFYPPGTGTAVDLNAIDEAYGGSPSSQDFTNGRLYTKLAGVPFKLNVAALNSLNQIDASYGYLADKVVTVKIVDNSDGVCELDSSKPNYCNTTCRNKAAVDGGNQSVTFTKTDGGKKQTANFTLNSAYKNLAVVLGDGTLNACSTDAFAVRPQAFSSVTTSASNANLTGTPKFKAGGDTFTIAATANASNYTGMPKVDNAKITAISPATVAGVIAPENFEQAKNSVATGNFTYSEVGRFTLGANGVADVSWTLVDQGLLDCVPNSFSNAKDASGKYGCNIGSVATDFGRFIPDHFTLLPGGLITPACGEAPNAFTYMSQPFSRLQYTVQAQNKNSEVTKNYAGALATGTVALVAENNDSGTDLGVRISIPAATWSAGEFKVDTAAATFARGATPDGAYDALQLGVKVTDADGVTLDGRNMNAATVGACESSNTCDSASVGSPQRVRFGRLRLTNAYGSERLNLPIPMRAEYYNGTTFVTNTLDNCTVVVASNIAMPAYKGGVTGSNMTVAKNVTAGGAFASGVGRLVLSPPNPKATTKGSVDVCVDLGPDVPVTPTRCVAATPLDLPWLKGRWTGAGYDDDPISRATFGVYKNSLGRGSEMIYFREMY